MEEIELRVNGRAHSIRAPREMPLLWALRDLLHLTGTKFGCGMGVCGACTVLVDGAAARACLTPIGEVGDREVTTIEGLGVPSLHRVQQTWIDLDVPQCGYCQSGQILSLVALLADQNRISETAAEEVLSANLCRCGSYPRIREALRRLLETGSASVSR